MGPLHGGQIVILGGLDVGMVDLAHHQNGIHAPVIEVGRCKRGPDAVPAFHSICDANLPFFLCVAPREGCGGFPNRVIGFSGVSKQEKKSEY